MSGNDNDTPPLRQFEARLEQLQKAVKRLEDDDLSLAETIDAYEEAVELANSCNAMLDAAELRVRTIDDSSRRLREEVMRYQYSETRVAQLLLGDDEDLADLLDDEE